MVTLLKSPLSPGQNVLGRAGKPISAIRSARSPNVRAWANRASGNPFLLGQQAYGSAIAPMDFIGALIRNPDELSQLDPSAYELVMSDPVVLDAMMSLASPLVNAQQEVTGTGDDELDQKLTDILNALVWLPECKEQLAYSFVTGMRLVESVWGRVALADGAEYIAPIQFIPHSVERFAFDPDGFLYMTQDGFQGSRVNRNDMVFTYTGKAAYVRWGKMLKAVYRNGDGRNGYGKGEGQILYRYMKAKENVMAYWLDYLSRYGVPPIKYGMDNEYVLQRNANGQSPDALAAAEADNIAAMRANDVFTYDKRNSLEFLEPSQTQYQLYEQLLRYCDEQMRLVITGEGSDPNGGGDGRAYATLAYIGQGEKAHRVKRLAMVLETTLANDLVRPIMRFNPIFKDVKHTRPRVRIKVSMVPAGEHLEIMRNSPFPILKSEFYNTASLTEPTQEQIDSGDAVVPSQAAMGGDPMLGGAGF